MNSSFMLCLVKKEDLFLTIDPSLDRRRVTLSMVASPAHITRYDRVSGRTGGGSLPSLADDAHDAAVVRRRGAQQLQVGYRRPSVRAVAELDQATSHARTHLARVIVIACTKLDYCSCS